MWWAFTFWLSISRTVRNRCCQITVGQKQNFSHLSCVSPVNIKILYAHFVLYFLKFMKMSSEPWLHCNMWSAALRLISWRSVTMKCQLSHVTVTCHTTVNCHLCDTWAVRYWLGYLSGARCKWFAYGPVDATATPSSLAPVKSRMVYLSGAGLPRLSWKKAIKRMS